MTRTCGRCTACCLTHAVFAIEKPEGKWCPECNIGRGCRIYASRPDGCRDFQCQWLMGVGNRKLRPDKCGIVIVHSSVVLLGLAEKMFSLWEARKGAIDTSLGRTLTQAALAHGLLVYHVYLSGKKRLFLPRGITLGKEVGLTAIEMGLEVIQAPEV